MDLQKTQIPEVHRAPADADVAPTGQRFGGHDARGHAVVAAHGRHPGRGHAHVAGRWAALASKVCMVFEVACRGLKCVQVVFDVFTASAFDVLFSVFQSAPKGI